MYYKYFRHLTQRYISTKIKPMGLYYSLKTAEYQNYMDGLEILEIFRV